METPWGGEIRLSRLTLCPRLRVSWHWKALDKHLLKEHMKKKERKGEENEIKSIDDGVTFRSKAMYPLGQERREAGEHTDSEGGGICDWWLLFSLWGRRLGHLLKMSGWVQLSDLRKNGKGLSQLLAWINMATYLR